MTDTTSAPTSQDTETTTTPAHIGAEDTGDTSKAAPSGGDDTTKTDDKGAGADDKGGTASPDDSSVLGPEGEADKKGDDTGTDDGKKDGDKETPTFELTVPDDANLDAELVNGYSTLAQEQGLSSEQASAVVAWFVDQTKAAETAQAEALKTQSAGWLDEVKADPKLGGENFAATCNDAKKALRQFGGEDLAKLYAQIGMENHPASIAAWAAVGRAMAEDNSGGGGGGPGGGAPQDRDAWIGKLYDKSNK